MPPRHPVKGEDDLKQDSDSSALLKASTQGTSFLVLIQVVSRALTFVGNQILLRYLSPEILGVATQLELYSISVLYFSRESLRVAIQRQPTTEAAAPNRDKSQAAEGAEHTQAIVNVSYLAIFGGILFAFGFGISYANYGGADALQTPMFKASVQIVGTAAVIELLAEPAFAVMQQHMLYKSRAITETAAAIAKCLFACGTALLAHKAGREVAVLPFAIGQLAYACVLVLGYSWFAWPVAESAGFSLLLRPLASRIQAFFHRFSRSLLSLTASLYVQSGVKQILTQGDSFILALLSNLSDQGVFALASNYGGLVARILFQPIEESSRNAFAKLVTSDAGDSKGKHAGVNAASTYLGDILRLYGILSIVIVSLGPTCLPLAIKIMMGSRWSSLDVTSILSTYCYYIPFLAYNGITEAFVSSVATESELRKQAIWMGAFSVGFAGAAYTFLRTLQMGAQGLVWANIANMTMRTAWSIWFIEGYLRKHGSYLGFIRLLPSAWSIQAGAAAAALVLRYSDDIIKAFGISIFAGLSM